jgi:hypothetical protein
MSPDPAFAYAWPMLSAWDGAPADPLSPALDAARGAAEGLRGRTDEDGLAEAWSAFAGPFDAAMETVRALAGLVPGLSVANVGEPPTVPAFPAAAARPPREARQVRQAREGSASAATSASPEGAVTPDGSSVETGNPGLTAILARMGSGNPSATPSAPPMDAKAAPDVRLRAVSRNTRATFPAASVPDAEAARSTWSGRLAQAIASAFPSPAAPRSPAGPASPLPSPADQTVQALFSGLLERLAVAPEGSEATEAAGKTPGDAPSQVTPKLPAAGVAGLPLPISDLQNLLAGMPLIGATGTPPAPGSAPAGMPAPFTGTGGMAAPSAAPAQPAGAPLRGPLRADPPVPQESPARSAGIEWLAEEDDLAERLNRLLRRQARRHGVDLP